MHKILLFGLWPILFLPIALPSFAASPFDRAQATSLVSAGAAHGLLLDIVSVPGSSRLIAVGEQGSILFSDDQGQQWQQAKAPVAVLLTAVQMVTSQQGWAVGHDGVVLHTGDGGLSWQVQLSGQDLLRVQQQGLQQALDVAEQTENAAQSDDLQWLLEDVEFALDDGAMPTLLDLYFIDEQRGFVAGAYGRMFATRDGGNNWVSLGDRLPNPDRMHLNSLLLSTSGRLLAAGEAGLLVYSDDLGESWQTAESPYEGSFFALAERDRLYVLGLRGHLFSSADGVNWQAESAGTDATLNAAVSASGKLYLLGQGGLVMKHQNNGFTPVSSQSRNSFAAGVLLDGRLILAGEGGITTLPLAEQGGAQ